MGLPKLNSLMQTMADIQSGSPEAQRVVIYGKTAGGVKVPLLVASDGTAQTSATLNAAASQVVVQPFASSLNATVVVSSIPNISVYGGSLSAYQGGVWNVGANGGSLSATILGTPAVTQSGTWNVGANGGSLSAVLLAGTNAIGTVIVSSLPVLPTGTNSIGNIGTVTAVTAITNALPAGTNTIGAIYDRPDVLNLSASLSAVAPQFAVINVAGSGDNTIVAATASKKTVVLQYSLVVGANGDGVTWKQGSTAVSGQMRFAANGGISAPYSPVGLFQTASGATLYLNSSLGSQVSGHILYVVV